MEKRINQISSAVYLSRDTNVNDECEELKQLHRKLSQMLGHIPSLDGVPEEPADDTTLPQQLRSSKCAQGPRKYRREDIYDILLDSDTGIYRIYSSPDSIITEATNWWCERNDLPKAGTPSSMSWETMKDWAVEVLRAKGLLIEEDTLTTETLESSLNKFDELVKSNSEKCVINPKEVFYGESIYDQLKKYESEIKDAIRARFGPNVHIEPGQDEDGRINGRWL